MTFPTMRAAALLLLLAIPTGTAVAADLQLAFADAAWDGVTVPEGQQCQRFGGQGVSPELVVSNIPSQANALIVMVSDRSYKPMDNGGHGQFGFSIEPGAATLTIPSVPGHTVDLPAGFFVVKEHQAPTWDKPGAYLPPCSGGRGNAYYITVKAVHRMGEESHELASADIELGKF
jgi:hypothetical protein